MRRQGSLWVRAALAALTVTATASRARAEDRAAVRVAYYREVNTRVVQPMVEASKDLPNGIDVGAHFAVDAISSASIAQGVQTDQIFEEQRYETSLNVGKTWNGHTRLGVFGRYSRESDYFAHMAGVDFSRGVWENTGTIGAAAAYAYDENVPLFGTPRQPLHTVFGTLSYAQVLTPTTVAQAGYELYYQHGFLGNAYLQDNNAGGREELPKIRLRHALAARVAQYFPHLRLGVQLHYRFYLDTRTLFSRGPWGKIGNSIEARVYKMLGRDLELRLGFRHERETAARFWCNDRPDSGGVIDCYQSKQDTAPYHSIDPKFGDLHASLVELKLTWDLRVLGHDGPLASFLSAGALDVSYGYYFQSTYYGALFTTKNEPPLLGDLRFPRSHGGGHLIQLGYSVPF